MARARARTKSDVKRDARLWVRFTPEVAAKVRVFAKEHNQTISCVIGEATELLIDLQPLFNDCKRLSQELAGEPLVLATIKGVLQSMKIELEEALGEVE